MLRDIWFIDFEYVDHDLNILCDAKSVLYVFEVYVSFEDEYYYMWERM